MTCVATTPESDTSEMSNGTNGLHESIEKLRLNGHFSGNGEGVGVVPTNDPVRIKMARKQSSPMMPAFMVSAPGKVIVFGEHAVVHGKAAVAASISLRSYLLVTTLSKSRRTLILRFPDIDLSHEWNIDELPWDAFQHPSKKKYYYDMVTELDDDLLAALRPLLAKISPEKSESERKVHQNAALAFLYLFLSPGLAQVSRLHVHAAINNTNRGRAWK
ncbi:hypothetical protein PG994_014365 [Apiospora phragmitis]|uniref:Mevalonate kinase n=1 Tax=Apiospora phragmitis TaxID=2905665 RepID=A0ABR1T6I0_9PEZI